MPSASFIRCAARSSTRRLSHTTTRPRAGEHGTPTHVAERTREALERYRAGPNAYVDAHAWYFTPASFQELLEMLALLGHTKPRVTRLNPTLRDSNELWVALEARALRNAVRLAANRVLACSRRTPHGLRREGGAVSNDQPV